jgi:lysophospholipase L1-like esterase
LLAQRLSQVAGHPVRAVNDARPGYTSADVLTQVETNATVMAHIQSADVVTLEIGANDVAFAPGCGAVAACYLPMLPQVQANITAIVQRIRIITVAHPVAIVLLDYWNVWLGGAYAAARGPAYVAAGTSLTYAESSMISAVAWTTGSAYVDLRLAFRGPDDTDDETALLAADGDHPDAAGHVVIAAVTAQVVLKALPA